MPDQQPRPFKGFRFHINISTEKDYQDYCWLFAEGQERSRDFLAQRKFKDSMSGIQQVFRHRNP